LRHSELVSAPTALPEVVTHYYLAGRQPFLSLSELPDAELGAVLADLRTLRDTGRQHRPFGPRYMNLRHRTEARLRELFIAAGGQPDRTAPHYFVLGESSWYRGLAANMALAQLPLSALPPTQTSITCPDSFTAMGLVAQFGIGRETRPYHGRVFLLGELADLVDEFGIPDPAWDGNYQEWATWPAEPYIEVQLWSDQPIADYLRSDGTPEKAVAPLA